jgi:hypothetical protein
MPWMALGQIVGIVITWWQVIRMIWWESRPSSCRSGCRECFPRRCTTDTANCYVIYRESWDILDFHLVENGKRQGFRCEISGQSVSQQQCGHPDLRYARYLRPRYAILVRFNE